MKIKRTKRNEIKPRMRPEITKGITEKVRIGCGNLYITVNYDDKGICEYLLILEEQEDAQVKVKRQVDLYL
ncbi:hypothetical protein [Caloranaerobacter azorensis]|uniref:hypothetical protein n=1 Tax=Caloranaerobacter azorensis TaxID=116090 RepID=UPI002022CDB3|nr:hypothetical protein [Caloranaerobacter azorensis]